MTDAPTRLLVEMPLRAAWEGSAFYRCSCVDCARCGGFAFWHEDQGRARCLDCGHIWDRIEVAPRIISRNAWDIGGMFCDPRGHHD